MKSEDKIQSEIVTWFKNNYCLKHHTQRCCIFAVPNGGKRNKKEAIKLKATGVFPGVSDLIVVFPKKILFVEVKEEKGSQSEVQEEFEQIITDLGYEYHICRSLEQFKTIIL